ncbi:MAG: tripartite tricarboxylate transporter TctB family protein [Gammaproteobacteria bacterium]|nr:tripartite tricarboxylate transporter TctB family protein [Gammaproteobacteria bacterium]
MRRIIRDTLGYGVLVLFCLWLLLWAIPIYTPEYPGYGAPPALVPNVAVWVMLVMACVALLRNVIALYLGKSIPVAEREFPEESSETSGFTQVGRVNLIHLGRIMIPCVLLLATIDHIGYIPAAFLFLIILQFLIGSRRWLQSVIVSIALVATLYVIMRYGFGVPVPGPQLF